MFPSQSQIDFHLKLHVAAHYRHQAQTIFYFKQTKLNVFQTEQNSAKITPRYLRPFWPVGDV